MVVPLAQDIDRRFQPLGTSELVATTCLTLQEQVGLELRLLDLLRQVQVQVQLAVEMGEHIG